MVLNLSGGGLFGASSGIGIDEVRAETVIVAQDGSGDTDDVQEGIKMLPSTGGICHIKTGTYTLTSSLVFPFDNIILSGAGRGTVLNANWTSGTFPGDEQLIDFDGKTGIIVKELFLTNTDAVS